MRIHKHGGMRIHAKNTRIHGGKMDPVKYTKNVEKLTKTFSNLLGSKKNVKFALKL